MTYPIEKIRSDFPILTCQVNQQPLTYLDSAASSQKPNTVINSQNDFYHYEYAAVHRGIHALSSAATMRMENIRSQIANFINASSSEEIIFVKGTTEGINLVVSTWGRKFLQPNDNILITEMEHHSNIVPWQMLAEEKQLELRFLPLLPDGTLDEDLLPKLIDDHTGIVAITQVSNVLGTQNPILSLISQVKSISNAVVLVDGAQYVMHHKIDVQELDCDFYVFSGHKMYAPSGIGVLYGKKKILDSMPPWEGGGSMIRTVSLTKKTTYNDVPWRFEAGSPNILGIIGLGAAIQYINSIGIQSINAYEHKLMLYAIESLLQVPNLILYGPKKRTGVIAFNLSNHHAYDVGIILDQYGIAIRTGHHCAMPLMAYFNVTSMCRVSLALYTTMEDVDCLVSGLIQVQNLLA